jgi:predicted Rossmann fold flavoprotein
VIGDTTWDAAVLGAGAAGLMCGIAAAARGKRVVVLEHSAVVGEKIRISGGGRCNFTNLGATPARYVSQNPRFAYSALARYTPKDFIALVEKHHIAYHEKKLGQLFCDGPSQQIIDMLLAELAAVGGEARTSHRVNDITQDGDGFTVYTSKGDLRARAVVVACGGLSIPKIGATPLAYEIAERFGVPIVPPRPALVPIVWNDVDAFHYEGLAGVSFECAARGDDGPLFREQALFTHHGLSGPAILQASSYLSEEGGALHIDMDPDNRVLPLLEDAKKQGRKAELRTVLAQHFVQRLAQRLCDVHAWHGPINTTKDATLRAIAHTLRHWHVRPAATEGYRKAEVTAGGIDTRALDPKTLQVKAVPGLYFIGECVDVTGWLGGYNFQWAWASGHACGTGL